MFERCLYFNINILARTVNKLWEESFQVTGLSAPHAYTLRTILSYNGISLKKLSEELHLDPSTMTRFVDVLVSKGLAEKIISPDDKRITHVYATKKGGELRADLEKTGDQLYRRMQKLIGSEKFNLLVLELRALNNKFNGD